MDIDDIHFRYEDETSGQPLGMGLLLDGVGIRSTDESQVKNGKESVS